MALHRLLLDMAFTATGDSDDDFDVFTDRVMDALYELEEINNGIHDPDSAGSITRRSLSVTMIVEADTRDDAVRTFLLMIRTALHMAGGNTRGWPKFDAEPLDATKVERVTA